MNHINVAKKVRILTLDERVFVGTIIASHTISVLIETENKERVEIFFSSITAIYHLECKDSKSEVESKEALKKLVEERSLTVSELVDMMSKEDVDTVYDHISRTCSCGNSIPESCSELGVCNECR